MKMKLIEKLEMFLKIMLCDRMILLY